MSPYEFSRLYSIVSVCTRFGVHDTGYSLSPPLFSHSCLAKARARWNESERKPLVSLRLSDAVSLRRTQSVLSRSPLRPERSEKRTLGIRVAVHYTGYSPVPTSEYIRRQYCINILYSCLSEESHLSPLDFKTGLVTFTTSGFSLTWCLSYILLHVINISKLGKFVFIA